MQGVDFGWPARTVAYIINYAARLVVAPAGLGYSPVSLIVRRSREMSLPVPANVVLRHAVHGGDVPLRAATGGGRRHVTRRSRPRQRELCRLANSTMKVMVFPIVGPTWSRPSL